MGNTNTLTKSTKRKAVDMAIVIENQEIQEAIRLKAYEIYLERNGTAGDEVGDWVIAERMVLKKFT
jgi:Protein of unknown function (DUF2934)